MPKCFEYEDPVRLKLVNELRAAARKEAAGVWDAVAKELFRSRRNRGEVNVCRINRHTGKGDVVVVPGKVLGDGNLDHKVEVAAFKFTENAWRKIEEAGGKPLSIQELLKKNPKGSNIKLIK